MRRFTLENVMPYGVDSRLKLDRLSAKLKCPRNRRDNRSRRLVAVELEVDLDPAFRVGVRRLERLEPSRARRDTDLPEERRGRFDASKPRLHEPDRMSAPGMAVASRLLLTVLAGIRRFLRRRKPLLNVVTPKIETLQEEIAAPELKICLEEVVREIHGAALEVLVLDKMAECGLGLVLRQDIAKKRKRLGMFREILLLRRVGENATLLVPERLYDRLLELLRLPFPVFRLQNASQGSSRD